LTGLTHLYFAGCHVQNITPDALQPLNSTLEELDMSRNQNLTFEGMNSALQGLENSTALQNLSANYLHIRYERSIELTKKDMRYISTMNNITNLYLDMNKIDILNAELFTPDLMVPPTLRKVSLAFNRLNKGKYIEYIYKAADLTYLDISRQFMGYRPFQFLERKFGRRYSYRDNAYKSDVTGFSTLHKEEREHYVWDYVIKAYVKHTR